MESLEVVSRPIVPSMEEAGHQQERYTGRERTRACMAFQNLIPVLLRPTHSPISVFSQITHHLSSKVPFFCLDQIGLSFWLLSTWALRLGCLLMRN